MYVLIIMMAAWNIGQASGSASVATAEFRSREACVAAGAAAMRDKPRGGRSGWSEVRYQCMPKGE